MKANLTFENDGLVSLSQSELTETEGGLLQVLVAGFIAGVLVYAAVTK